MTTHSSVKDPTPEELRDLARLDEAKITPFHRKVMFISGMGFFTDAYDLFIIGIVMKLITNEWHPSTLAHSLITSTALLSAMLGALVFGRIADVLGRKKVYGVECAILAAGAIASALAPSIGWLIAFRFILGLGIGGDYPVSAVIMSEYAGKRTRGKLVALVFANQAAGLIVGPLIAWSLLAAKVPHPVAWRVMLALGAVPALAVYYLRRKIHETPRFQIAMATSCKTHRSFWGGLRELAQRRRIKLWLAGTSLSWFLMDFAYYGNTVSSPMVLGAIGHHRSVETDTLIQLGIFVVAAAPGYAVAALTMDRVGRKTIQILGFSMMAAAFACLGFIPGIARYVVPFVIIFGISYFFTEFGPNATTFVYPSEIFPARLRTTCHGIAAAVGKLGAFVGVLLFPIMMKGWHLSGAEIVAAGVSLAGALVTWAMLPEPKRKSLEDLTGEDARAPVAEVDGERRDPCAPAIASRPIRT